MFNLQELLAASFPSTGSSGPFDVLTRAPKGGCRDSPGPASTKLFCVKSTSPSWVAFRWYRFVDQPGMQQLGLTATERAFVQGRVEALHRMMPTPKSRWLKAHNAAGEGLCAMDTAAIVAPPEGLEAGFVPIALYEGLDQPPNCDEVLTPPPLPPSPPPSPPPSCHVPHPSSCEGKCVADGHCCQGTLSSWQTTSCAQGCIIAQNVDSVRSCMRPHRTSMHSATAVTPSSVPRRFRSARRSAAQTTRRVRGRCQQGAGARTLRCRIATPAPPAATPPMARMSARPAVGSRSAQAS